MSTLALNCFILGDDSSEVFVVDILKSQSVSNLKDLIKKIQSPRLDHVAAPELTTWKVSFPIDAITPELAVDDVGGRQELRSVKRISSIFDDSEVLGDEHVYILIQAPIGTLHKRFIGLSRHLLCSFVLACRSSTSLAQLSHSPG